MRVRVCWPHPKYGQSATLLGRACRGVSHAVFEDGTADLLDCHQWRAE